MAPLSAPSRSAARAGIVKPTRGLSAVITLALGLGGAWLATVPCATPTRAMDDLTRARQRIAEVQGRNRSDRADARYHTFRPRTQPELLGSLRRPFELDLRPAAPTPTGSAFDASRLFPATCVQEFGPGNMLLSPPAGERLGFGTEQRPADGAAERPEWTRLRRQLSAALPDRAELIQASPLGIAVRCAARHDVLGNFTTPGLVQDAATAARVRSSLAADPRTRDLPRNVTCEAGCVRLAGPFPTVASLALAVNAALAVDGVREVRADLPEDMLVLVSR